MYQAKSGVKKFSLYWGGGGVPQQKFFSSLNMYQAKSGVKNFSLYWGRGGFPCQKIFFQSEHVSSQIWCQKFFPLLRPGTPLDLRLGTPPNLRLGTPPPGPRPGTPPWDLDLGSPSTQTWDPPRTWTLDPPSTWTWDPLYLDLDLGPPTTWTWDPPWTDTHLWKHNLPSYLRTRAVKINAAALCVRLGVTKPGFSADDKNGLQSHFGLVK